MSVLVPADLDACLSFAEELASWAIDRIGTEAPPKEQVDTKLSPDDYVTETDRAVEQQVRAMLHARFPEHQVIGEEFGTGGGDPGDLVWYVDPLDGTANYVHGLPFCAFSLALADEHGAAVGVIADPFRGEIFSAARGRGAWLNDRPIQPEDRDSLGGAVVITEWGPWDGMVGMLKELQAAGCATRVLGSMALSLAYTAAGRAAATLVGDFQVWDVLAGTVIAREAGLSVLSREHGGQVLAPDAALPDAGLMVALPGVVEPLRLVWAEL